jgi:hypothetical protein
MSRNNIFLYLELTKYFTFKTVPLGNAPLLPPFMLLEAMFKGCLRYHLQVLCHISDDVFHCLKSYSINPSASTVFKPFPTAQPMGYLIFIQKNAPIHEKINISRKSMIIEIKFSQKYLK